MIQRTLVLLKPDAVQRCFCGELIARFERVGLKIVGMKMVWVSAEQSKKHYSAHVKKDFYPGLEKFITQGPVVAMVLEGVDSVEVVRKLVGSTEPKTALPGTIRGDYAHVSLQHANEKGTVAANLIHASGNAEEAKYEVSLWFKPEELHSYKTVHDIQTILE
ncbi:nucleoside-diphosphate kinase [Candidatus Woesearchaeota archaeon]|nr:nucleoside-diphosphate kinase [Candidatus Woesearchaeota archaeon]